MALKHSVEQYKSSETQDYSFVYIQASVELSQTGVSSLLSILSNIWQTIFMVCSLKSQMINILENIPCLLGYGEVTEDNYLQVQYGTLAKYICQNNKHTVWRHIKHTTFSSTLQMRIRGNSCQDM